LGGPARPPEPSGPGEARSRFKGNKYGLKKLGAFTVTKGHGFPHQCLSRQRMQRVHASIYNLHPKPYYFHYVCEYCSFRFQIFL
jgi:hypothetical protein